MPEGHTTQPHTVDADKEFDIFNLLESDTLERELELCAQHGADVGALKSLNFDIYQLAEIRKGYEAGIDVSRYLDPHLSWSQMEEIRLELTENIDMSAYRDKGYDDHQIYEIRKGISRGLDVSQYDAKEYFAEQMREIRKGLLSGVPVVFYRDPKYSNEQMREIRKGLEQNLDISLYAKSDMPYLKMRVARQAMRDGLTFSEKELASYPSGTLEQLHQAFLDHVDLKPYIKEGFDAGQLEHIRIGLKEGLDVDKYMQVTMRGESLKEIRKGLESGIDVSVYANDQYNWQQMRELRLGLENRIDVTAYAKPLYQAAQMHEIRLGLEAGLDVTLYHSMIHTAADMKQIRERLIHGAAPSARASDSDSFTRPGEGGEIDIGVQKPSAQISAELLSDSGRFLTITDDGLYCYLKLPRPKKTPYTVDVILAVLEKAHVTHGIDKAAIEDILNRERYDSSVVVARGKAPVIGEDGHYEYFFDTNVPSKPAFLEDGSADLSNVKYFEQVNAGDKLALYHPAVKGSDGFAVTGELLPGKSGKELPVIKGKGFMVLEDKHTYCAAVSGVVKMQDGVMTISRLMTVDEASFANGDITYSGSVLVKGDLRSGVKIEADGDVIIEGTMGGGTVVCTGDAIFREGVVGRQIAKINVQGRIISKFLEDATVEAHGPIFTNACLNCNVKTDESLTVYGDKGTVYGGTIQTITGLSCAILGNRNTIRTNVSMGIPAELLINYNKSQKAITRVTHELARFKEEQEKLSTVPSANREVMQLKIKVNAAVAMKDKELRDLTARKIEQEAEIKRVSGANARVTEILHAGVVISIDGAHHIYDTDITGQNGLTVKKRGANIVAERN